MMYNPCNYCTYERMVKDAAVEGMVLLKQVDPSSKFFPDAVRIFKAPKEQVETHKTYLLGEPVAWFAELPTKCAC